jgi:GxxExxY protein
VRVIIGVPFCPEAVPLSEATSARQQKNDDARGAFGARIMADSAERARMKIDKGILIDKELTGSVIGGFYDVYNAFGFGFNENVYASGLTMELGQRGLVVQREVPKQVYYNGQPIAIYRVDMLVENRLVVEVKATKLLVEADHKQLFNYLRVTDLQLGLLLHFGPRPRFFRVISTYKPFKSHPDPGPSRDSSAAASALEQIRANPESGSAV